MEFFKKIEIKKMEIDSSDFKKLFKYISGYKNKSKIEKTIIELSKNNRIIRNSINLHKLLEENIRNKIKIPKSITISGTGGDGKNTMNLTTSTAIIVSMLGIKTIKNNGRSYITNKGSYRFINKIFKNINKKKIEDIIKCYKKTKLLPFSFKQVIQRNFFGKSFSELRKKIGKVTIFNYSLSSLNIFKSKYFMLCTNSPIEIYRLSKIVKQNGSNYSTILSSYDEIDEPTLFKKIKIIKNKRKKSMEVVIDSKKIGFKEEKNNKYLYSKNIKESYRKFINTIDNKKKDIKVFKNIKLFICLILNLRFEKKINYVNDILENVIKTKFFKKKLEKYKEEFLWKE
ncbi:hypothetical protein [Candidatus Vidania fulgoroideorum]